MGLQRTLIPLWREARLGLEAAALLRSETFRGEGVEHAGGQPVVLIPGLFAGDDSLGLMTSWLRRTGHYTRKAGMRSNVACSSEAVERLAERVEVMAECHGQRVAIVGQSRGGHFAKVLAVRHPDLISGIVTLGSPQLDPFDIHPLVEAQILGLGVLGALGVPGLFKPSCRWGSCCRGFWEEMRSPIREDVGYVSIYSRTDGVVNWRGCLDPSAEHVEVESSHCGMAVHPTVYEAVARALAHFRRDDQPEPNARERLERSAVDGAAPRRAVLESAA